MTIYAEFVKAYTEVENPPLDSVNPHYGNKYSSLGATLAVIEKACEAQGLIYRQEAGMLTSFEDNRCVQVLNTYITNAKGERMNMSTLYLPMVDNPQQAGGDLTYRKRQVAQLDWGIVGEEDDDGETAIVETPVKKPKTTRKKSSRPERIARIMQLKEQAVKAGIKKDGIDAWFKAKYGEKMYKDLTDADLIAIESHLETLIDDAREVNL